MYFLNLRVRGFTNPEANYGNLCMRNFMCRGVFSMQKSDQDRTTPFVAGFPVRFRQDSLGIRTGVRTKPRREGGGQGKNHHSPRPPPLRSFSPLPSPTPERTGTPETQPICPSLECPAPLPPPMSTNTHSRRNWSSGNGDTSPVIQAEFSTRQRYSAGLQNFRSGRLFFQLRCCVWIYRSVQSKRQ